MPADPASPLCQIMPWCAGQRPSACSGTHANNSLKISRVPRYLVHLSACVSSRFQNRTGVRISCIDHPWLRACCTAVRPCHADATVMQSASSCTPELHSHHRRFHGRGVAWRCYHRSRARPARRRCLLRSRLPRSRAPRCPHPHPPRVRLSRRSVCPHEGICHSLRASFR